MGKRSTVVDYDPSDNQIQYCYNFLLLDSDTTPLDLAKIPV